MDLYAAVSADISKLITQRYSTSFGLSSTLFPAVMRRHIYAIYGLVRIADEVVDTYRGPDMAEQLNDLERAIYHAIKTGYSTNPVIHAFALTTREYAIANDVIEAFFTSMRMDTQPYKNTQANYERYIYGSAEAVGLMCLSVFTGGDRQSYESLAPGARALGAAYQKINFLRDLASDSTELKRWYFPDSSFDTFGDKDKARIYDDIARDLEAAKASLARLPRSSKRAVRLSLEYYERLLKKLRRTSATELKRKRLRISNATKLVLYAKTRLFT